MQFTIKEKNGFSYIDEGQGQPIVLFHGLFGALSNWSSVLEEFMQNYRVVIPMLPIYTGSLLKSTVNGLAEYAHEYIKKFELEDPILVGNSLGGHVAMAYILKYKPKYKALLLTGSSGLFENAMGGSFPKRGDYDYIKAKTEYTFYDPKSASKELVDEVFDIVNDRGKVIRVLSMSKSAMRHNLNEELHKIEKPTMLIWGKEDNITPPSVAEEFHKLIPNSQLTFIDKCGHAPMMEQPLEFNRIMKEFLSKIK